MNSVVVTIEQMVHIFIECDGFLPSFQTKSALLGMRHAQDVTGVLIWQGSVAEAPVRVFWICSSGEYANTGS